MIQIGKHPDAGFDQPLTMLSDCHRRIERFLAGFLVVARSEDDTLTPELRETLRAVLDYFAHAGVLHTQDEDESLFPRLLACQQDLQVLSVRDTLELLQEDHTLAVLEHATAAALGQRWLERGMLTPTERRDLLAAVETLDHRYRTHILLEDGVIFPLAAQVLPAAELAAVGREMAARRAS